MLRGCQGINNIENGKFEYCERIAWHRVERQNDESQTLYFCESHGYKWAVANADGDLSLADIKSALP